MKKVIFCWTSDNGYDWLDKEYLIDENNYMRIINEYYSETNQQAEALCHKWEIGGNPDPLFFNFRFEKPQPTLFKLIDNYIETYF